MTPTKRDFVIVTNTLREMLAAIEARGQVRPVDALIVFQVNAIDPLDARVIIGRREVMRAACIGEGVITDHQAALMAKPATVGTYVVIDWRDETSVLILLEPFVSAKGAA